MSWPASSRSTRRGSPDAVKCPFCAEPENKVIDSRLSNQGAVIRRRRECLGCQRRFTTYERVEGILPVGGKKDGRRGAVDRQKVVEGAKAPRQKGPGGAEQRGAGGGGGRRGPPQ